MLKSLAPQGQFIFFLEAIVQMSALFVFHDKLREPYRSFIVNTGARLSFFLGYGSRLESSAVDRASQFGCKHLGVHSRGDSLPLRTALVLGRSPLTSIKFGHRCPKR